MHRTEARAQATDIAGNQLDSRTHLLREVNDYDHGSWVEQGLLHGQRPPLGGANGVSVAETCRLGANRDRFEIMASILETSLRGAKKTWILYASNLSVEVRDRYMEQLTTRGLLAKYGRQYYTTGKGEMFLGAYEHLIRGLMK
ncbi:winged helix-turn-helix domain-containing protein [Candidatus Bathyarchaeota archaeon]|nr:winged helix-turn-helix domain-containing protein [Candidatus Bathyarchaeota archaeon]